MGRRRRTTCLSPLKQPFVTDLIQLCIKSVTNLRVPLKTLDVSLRGATPWRGDVAISSKHLVFREIATLRFTSLAMTDEFLEVPLRLEGADQVADRGDLLREEELFEA